MKSNTSGFKGVHFDKKWDRWVASIKTNGRSIFLGGFDTAQEAADAYDTAALEYHGEFAWTKRRQQMMVSRPPVQFFGGKWKLAPWIVSQLPRHHTYVEPYGGGASVLLRKTPSKEEIYNDLDQSMVNLFRVLRDSAKAEELKRRLELSPISRMDYLECHKLAEGDDIEQARKLIIISNVGFGTVRTGRIRNGSVSGFRVYGWEKKGLHHLHSIWNSTPECIQAISMRMKNVVIESKPALDLIREWDKPTTLFMADPPYVTETRTAKNEYSLEMNTKDHIELAKTLRQIKGMAVVCGFDCELYRRLYKGWKTVSSKAYTFANDGDCDSARTEMLWISPTISRNFLF